jgi:hypothetical protein
MRYRHLAIVAALALALAGTSCGGGDDVWGTFPLTDGTYAATAVHGHDPADEAKLRSVTAALDLGAGTVTLRLADGTQRVLEVTPRAGWISACPTMSSHARLQAADLSPAPLQVESMTFVAPMIQTYCWSGRLLLSDDPPSQDFMLVFDRR